MSKTVVAVLVIVVVVVAGLPLLAQLRKGGNEFAGSVWAGALAPGVNVEVQYEFRKDGVMKMSVPNAGN